MRRARLLATRRETDPGWLDRSSDLGPGWGTAVCLAGDGMAVDAIRETVESRVADAWLADAGVTTLASAVAGALDDRRADGESVEPSPEEWREFGRRASWSEMRDRAERLGVRAAWDSELPKTPDGYYGQARTSWPSASRLRGRGYPDLAGQ